MFRRVSVTFLIFIFILSSCFFTGCWNSRELNTIGIIGVFALDLEDDKVKVTCETIKPAASKDGKVDSKVTYVESVGDSMFDAIRNVTTKFDRKLFFPHIKVYVISEDLARKGLIDYIDWYQRDHEPRRSGYILIAKGIKAKEALGITGGIEGNPADYLERLVSFMSANSKVEAVTILQFLKSYYAQGVEPVAGMVQKVPKVKIQEENQQSKAELNAEGTAVFLRGNLVGFLNGEETRGFNYITNKVKSGIIVLNKGEKNTTTSLEILKSKCKNSVEFEGNKPKIKVKIKVSAVIGEENENLNLKKPENIHKLESLANKSVKEDIEASIKKVKDEYKSDIFGFGVTAHQKHPKKWKEFKNNWNELFSEAEFDINVETKINRTGLVDVPANFMEEK